ncbi:hypothetical protein FRC17_000650 [Serendipita sp. 399]|nr:hypothetical protein FRC17_000650 [Serendipita sp. 399]
MSKKAQVNTDTTLRRSLRPTTKTPAKVAPNLQKNYQTPHRSLRSRRSTVTSPPSVTPIRRITRKTPCRQTSRYPSPPRQILNHLLPIHETSRDATVSPPPVPARRTLTREASFRGEVMDDANPANSRPIAPVGSQSPPRPALDLNDMRKKLFTTKAQAAKRIQPQPNRDQLQSVGGDHNGDGWETESEDGTDKGEEDEDFYIAPSGHLKALSSLPGTDPANPYSSAPSSPTGQAVSRKRSRPSEGSGCIDILDAHRAKRHRSNATTTSGAGKQKPGQGGPTSDDRGDSAVEPLSIPRQPNTPVTPLASSRRHSSSPGNDVQERQVQTPRSGGRRHHRGYKSPRPWHLGKYTPAARGVLQEGRTFIKQKTIGENAFPTGKEKENNAKAAWEQGVTRHPVLAQNSTSLHNFNKAIERMFNDVVWETRGSVVGKAREVAFNGYELGPPHCLDEGNPRRNVNYRRGLTCDRVKALLGTWKFLFGPYRMPDNTVRDDIPFTHRVIWDIIYRSYFSPKPPHDELALLNPIPAAAIVLASTAAYCAIQDYENGEQAKVKFKVEKFSGIYGDLFDKWDQFETEKPTRAMNLRKRITAHCFERMGASGDPEPAARRRPGRNDMFVSPVLYRSSCKKLELNVNINIFVARILATFARISNNSPVFRPSNDSTTS